MTGHFFFDPADPIYRDHFPGRAVVPGSLVVHAFLKAIKRFGISTHALTVRDFRFKHFIAPGRYSFHIRRLQAPADGLLCELRDGAQTLVKGTIDDAA